MKFKHFRTNKSVNTDSLQTNQSLVFGGCASVNTEILAHGVETVRENVDRPELRKHT